MKKPNIILIGEDGNIFNLLLVAKKRYRELHKEDPEFGWNEIWKEFTIKVESSDSYDNALVIFSDHFDIG